ncbi:MarR family winged helix-turn-helix transcriptional regulator [Haloferax profundi]|uniref:Uncharacterized protein n=1 Tax=Haloferax profundi TaxID=1544718 RepID=A0A0W1RE09_9EURY|nr:MarR family winged helix-turn-helix transcriptional regulator [Haloferax profundi]KTG11720.1 hypothetical protein AUR66_19945 [Haloferax profundi]
MEHEGLGDLSSFVLNSKYRKYVIENLARATLATPTEIAEKSDCHRPHISRAVSELRDENIVELSVSDDRTVGRYYCLTDTGEQLWDNIKDKIQQVNWQIVEPDSDIDTSFVDVAHNELGKKLRFIGKYDGESASILYADPDAVAEYTDEELEKGIREFVYRRVNMELNVPRRMCWAQTFFFESEAITMVKSDTGVLYSATFESYSEVDISALLSSLQQII